MIVLLFHLADSHSELLDFVDLSNVLNVSPIGASSPRDYISVLINFFDVFCRVILHLLLLGCLLIVK